MCDFKKNIRYEGWFKKKIYKIYIRVYKILMIDCMYKGCKSKLRL